MVLCTADGHSEPMDQQVERERVEQVETLEILALLIGFASGHDEFDGGLQIVAVQLPLGLRQASELLLAVGPLGGGGGLPNRQMAG